MMDHFIIATQSGILIFDGVKAMGAAGHDLFDVVTIQHLYVHHSLHLEKKLIPRALGRVAGAAFFRSQNGILNPDMLQYFANVAGDLLRALVKTARTAYPKQDIRRLPFGGHFGHGWYSLTPALSGGEGVSNLVVI